MAAITTTAPGRVDNCPPSGRDGEVTRTVFEPRDGVEEVTRLGQSVRADRPEVGQPEVAGEHLW